MFDAKLFLELCEEYNVPLASSSGKCQIQKGDILFDLTDGEVDRILNNFKKIKDNDNGY